MQLMKVTGYQLREAIKRHTFVRDTALSVFNDSLKAFPDEHKDAPTEAMNRLMRAEFAIAMLQEAQAGYNASVTVDDPTRSRAPRMTLGAAVKLVGGYGRAEKLWRQAAQPGKSRASWRDDDQRNKDIVIAMPQIPHKEAAALAEQMARVAASLRQAIALGNAVEVDMKDLDSSLFE